MTKNIKGITLIALIITIIVLLILAGVSISLVVGENGILNKAQSASERTKLASEKEAIDLAISDFQIALKTGEDIDKSKIGGEELFTKNLENSSKWKIITETVDGNVVKKYGTDWYYLKKGTNLGGTELSKDYIVNYVTGEMVEFDETKHKILSYKDVLGYSDNLILNIDPGIMDEYNNLTDEEKKKYDIKNLGEGVELIGYTGSDGKADLSQAFTKSSYKFDGIDDYIKINYDGNDNVKNIVENGITFEYYGTLGQGRSIDLKTNEVDSAYEYKGLFGYWNGNDFNQAMFRLGISFKNAEKIPLSYSAMSGNILLWWDPDYVNDIKELYGPNMKSDSYWNQEFYFDKNLLNDKIYLTIVIDPKETKMYSDDSLGYNNLCIKQKLYINKELVVDGWLNKKYWDFLSNDKLGYDFKCFCVGRCSTARDGFWHYIKGDCYSLRFYDKALTEKQIFDNYEKTIDYHELLEAE